MTIRTRTKWQTTV